MPAVVEALGDLNSATSSRTKTSCFREFKGAFKNAKKSIVPSDLTIQSSLCSAGESLRNDQGILTFRIFFSKFSSFLKNIFRVFYSNSNLGITNAFNMIELEIEGGINRWLDSTIASNVSSMPPSSM